MVSDIPSGPVHEQGASSKAIRRLGSLHHLLVDLAAEQASQPSAPPGEQAETYLRLAAAALERGRLDEAAGAYRSALALRPGCPEAYGGLALICHQRGAYPLAQELYFRCLEQDSDNLAALLGLFQASRQMGSFAKIIHCLEVYLTGHAEDVSVLFCLATLYAREGRFQPASECLRRLLALDPTKTEAAELLRQVQAAAAPAGEGPCREPAAQT